MDETGYVRVGDFGIAEFSKQALPTVRQRYMGTPNYIAPEVLAKREHEYSIDYYALGRVAAKCLLGHL